MTYSKIVVEGRLVRETETHYITATVLGTCSWSKAWYRLGHNL